MKETASAGCGRRFKRFLRATLLGLLCAASVEAQEAHQRHYELGKVNFPVSCSASAQKQFNRAVAWLHSFEYEEVEKAFTHGTLTDPKCGMGYWDVAMSNYHPIWAPPTVEELKKGQAAVEKARSVGARTECEWDYIAATGYWRWSPWAPYSVWRSGSDPIWALSSSSKNDAGRRRRCR